MKRSSYMSREELKSWLFCGAMAGQAAVIAEQTQEKDWRQKLKTAAKYLENITNERLKCLDKDQLLSVVRRRKGTKVVMSTEDKYRQGAEPKEVVVVDLDDLESLAELALTACKNCLLDGRQGINGPEIKRCPYRKVYHKLGIAPAENKGPLNETMCEFVSR